MKYAITALTVVLTAALTTPAWAGEGSDRKGNRPGREEMRQKILEEFDADGDGQLSEDERANAREEMRSRREERRGKQGPGARERGPEGRPPRDRGPEGRRGREGRGPEGRGGPGRGGPPRPEEMFDRFDENGDGQLSRDEFMEMAHHVRQMREQRFGQAGPPARRGDREGRRGPGAERPDRRGPPRGEDGDFRRRERPRRPRPDAETSVDEPLLDEPLMEDAV